MAAGGLDAGEPHFAGWLREAHAQSERNASASIRQPSTRFVPPSSAHDARGTNTSPAASSNASHAAQSAPLSTQQSVSERSAPSRKRPLIPAGDARPSSLRAESKPSFSDPFSILFAGSSAELSSHRGFGGQCNPCGVRPVCRPRGRGCGGSTPPRGSLKNCRATRRRRPPRPSSSRRTSTPQTSANSWR